MEKDNVKEAPEKALRAIEGAAQSGCERQTTAGHSRQEAQSATEREWASAASPIFKAPITLENIERVLTYHPWDLDQRQAAEPVAEAVLALGRAILRHVPNCPDRSVAIRKLRELLMDVNSAITHRGLF